MMVKIVDYDTHNTLWTGDLSLLPRVGERIYTGDEDDDEYIVADHSWHLNEQVPFVFIEARPATT